MRIPGMGWLVALSFLSMPFLGKSQTLTPICGGSGSYNTPWVRITPDHDIQSDNVDENVGRTSKVYVDKVHDPSLNTVYVGTENSGLWKTTNYESANPNWECLTCASRLPGMGVLDIAINPDDADDILIATGIGLINEIGLLTYYGAGVMHSTDGGLTWNSTSIDYNVVNEPLVAQQVRYTGKIGANGKRHVIVASQNQLYLSTDGGDNYTLKYTNTSGTASYAGFFLDVEVHPNDPDKIYATTYHNRASDGTGTGSRFVVSDDGGNTWVDKTCQIPGVCDVDNNTKLERIDLSVTPADDDLVVLYAQHKNGAKFIWTTSNPTAASISWQAYEISNPDTKDEEDKKGSWYMNDIELSRTNPNLFYLGTVKLWKVDLTTATGSGTKNVAATAVQINYWKPHPDKRDILALIDLEGNERIYNAHDGGIGHWVFNGTSYTWYNKNGFGLSIQQFFGLGVSSKLGFEAAGAQDMGFFYRFREWDNIVFGDGYRAAIDEEGKSFYVGQNSTVYEYPINDASKSLGVSTAHFDRGRDFPMDIGADGRLFYAYKRPSDESPFPGNWLMIYDPSNGTGTRVQPKLGTHHVSSLRAAPSNSNVLYIGDLKREKSTAKLWKFTDTPSGWQREDLTSTLVNATHLAPKDLVQGFTAIAVAPDDENEIWIGLNQNTKPNSRKILYHADVTDASINWEEINNGLPNFPINHLEIDKINGIMYAATDVGVFVNLDPKSPTSNWECYNMNLPVVKVTDVQIDYCSRKLYASTYGRGIWVADLAIDHQVELHVTEIDEPTAPWGNREQLTDVVVKSGHTLTISGTVKMAKGRSIIVEQGAQLIVDGGTITSLCDLWSGIRVWGNPCLPQTTANQGKVRLINGAILSNAENAISTSKQNPDGSIDWANSGGAIVSIDNATFRNNARSIEFLRYPSVSNTCFQGTYPNRNVSRISNCTFETTEQIPGQLPNGQYRDYCAPAMVTLWDVNRVLFYNCTFRNTSPELFPYNLLSNRKGAGISSLGASYLVHYSTFENLSYGILDNNTANFTKGTRAENNTFTNVERALSVRGGRGDELRNNTVHYDPGFGWVDPADIDRHGIELYNSHYFNVWDNTVKTLPGGAFSGVQRGAYVVNTGHSFSVGTGDVYRNLYENMAIGIATEEDNAYLRIRCNDFNDNQVTDWMSNQFSPSGDPANQGSCLAGDLPGNEFKLVPMSSDKEHIEKPTSPWTITPFLNYEYDLNNTRAPQSSEVSTWVRLKSCASASATCPSKNRNGNGGYYGDIPMRKNDLQPLVLQLQNGDDPVVIGNINDPNYPTTALEMDINPLRPHLSDDMLIAMINRVPAFSDSYLKSVLVEHSGLSDTVYAALQSNPLPPAMMAEIDAEQAEISDRSLLENQIASHRSRLFEACGQVLMNFQDSLSYDSIQAFVIQHGDVVSDEYKIATAIELGQFTDAQNYLVQYLPTVPDEVDLKDFLQLKYDLVSQGKNWYEMDAAQLNTINTLAPKENLAGVYAKSVQILLGGDMYDIPTGNASGTPKRSPLSTIKTAKTSNHVWSIYPNPARSQVEISFDETLDETIDLMIYSSNGQVVHQEQLAAESSSTTIAVNDLKPGVYLITVRSESLNKNAKLVVE
ncbi:T9SS type A sorting domain-containing protein [bacterium SCSIO 12741]|nr:T9SS type A sorting domain-containing protein [bacterium SCSIO 12741]